MKAAELVAWLSTLPPDSEVDFSIRSVRTVEEVMRRAPKTAAERMRDLRARNREKSDAERNGSSPNVTKSYEPRNGDRNGGAMGGLISEETQKSGKEEESPDLTLAGLDSGGAHEGPKTTAPVTLRKSRRNVTQDPDVVFVFEAWKLDTGHPKAFLDPKRASRIASRLSEGKTRDDLVLAIRNRRRDPWLMGENGGKVYDGIETLLRDAGQVERLMALAAPSPAAASEDASERRRRAAEAEARVLRGGAL